MSVRALIRPMERGFVTALAVTFLVQYAPVWGQDFEGEANSLTRLSVAASSTEGALFLLLPVGAHGVSMGRAMTALSSQESAFWNPAGLAGMKESRIMVYRGDHLAGEATAISLLLNSDPVGTLGISYQLLDAGSQDLKDENNQITGSISVRSQQAVISFATTLIDRLDAGINFKVVQFRVGCRGRCLDGGVNATSYAIDAGVLVRPLDRIPLRLGAMIAHLGTRLQVINAQQADPLPTRIRISAAYEMIGHFVESRELDLWVSLEMEDRWRNPGSPSLYFGTELSAGRADLFFVRAGYIAGELDQEDGAALGLGLRIRRLELGIAKSLASIPLTGESEPVHVTLGLTF